MPKSEHRSEHSLSRSYREVTVHSDGRSGTMSKSIAGGRRKTASEANAATVSTAHVGQAVQVAVALLIPVLLLAAIITYDLVTVTKLNQDQTNATTTANHALDLDDCAMAIADELYTILDRNINLGAAMEFRLAAARTATTQACAQPLYSETAGYFENVMTPLATVRANAASLGALSITLSWTNVNIAVLSTATALLDSLPPAVLPNATVGRQTSLLGNLYVYLSALSYFQWLGRTVVQIDNTIFSLNAASLLTAAQLVYPSTTSPYNTFVVRNCINAVMVPLPQYGDPTAARACLPALASLRLIRESVRNSAQTVHSDASTWYTSRIGPISGITFIAFIVIVVAFVSIFFAQRATTRDLQEELINRKNTMESIQAFVPAQFLVFLGIRVITELTVDDPQEIQLTVLSSDIRAFTSISEQMTDVELFFWLQEHLELMTSACRRAGGFIEKYIGDAVLCLFEHSADAIRCGIDMQYTVDEANASRVARGEEYMVRVGVGIHTGNTLLGVVGDEKCQNTSVVSRAVDMSAKLEELTKVYGAKIIVSETTFDDAAMVIGDTRRLGEFKYDGQSVFLREIYVTETHAIRDYKNGSKKNFEAAVAARDRGNISEANMYFDRVLAFPKPRGYEDLAAVKVMEF